MCHQRSSKRSTIVSNRVWPSRPDPNQELSGEPGAVHECEYGGENLLDWVTNHRVIASLGERLAVFVQAADAVAAAHSVGVLHKDLKPANLLISQTPKGPWVRVGDFGCAQLIEPDRLAALGITQFGMTVSSSVLTDPGSATLLYLAPERLSGGPATVKSDVYALGILLYQLVVGDLRKPLVPGWERDVPDEILREIIMAATDGDSAVRLGSVADLADRVRHIEESRAERLHRIAGEQRVKAAQDALRRARVRRPWLIATVTALCLGIIGTLVLYGRVRAAQRAQSRQYAIARALNSFLTSDFIAVANPTVAGRSNITVVEAMQVASSKIDGTFKGAGPEVLGGLHAAMQKAFASLSEFSASVAQGRLALVAFGRARPADRARMAEVHVMLALTLAKSSKLNEAAAELAAANALIKSAHLENPSLDAQYWWAKASIDSYRLALPQALGEFREAWIMAQRAANLPPRMRDEIQFSYADTLKLSGKFDAAERQASDLLASERVRLGASSPLTCYTAALLASILGYRNLRSDGMIMAQQASDCLLKSLGPSNLRTISTYLVLADLQFQSRRYDDAADTYDQVAAMSTNVVGPRSLWTISAKENAGVAQLDAGQIARAEESLTAALALADAALGWTHPMTEVLRYHLADCRLDRKRTHGVARLLASLSVPVLNEGEIETDWAGRLDYEQGRLDLYTGRAKPGLSQLRTAVQMIGAKDPDNPMLAEAMRVLAHSIRQ